MCILPSCGRNPLHSQERTKPMKNTLSIPTTIGKTQPKPTKTQLIEALLEKAREKWEKEKKELVAAQKEIQKEIEDKSILILSKKMKRPEVMVDSIGNVTLKIEMNEPIISSLGKKHAKSQPSYWFHEEMVKEKIKESLKTPNPLIDNPDVAVALENLLESIMKPAKKTIEAWV